MESFDDAYFEVRSFDAVLALTTSFEYADASSFDL